MLADFSQLLPRLARALLNSAAPVLKDRFAPSRRNCMATRAPIGGGALLRIESLPSRPLSFCEEDGRERRFGFLRTNAPCRRSGRARKKGEESWSRLFVLDVAVRKRGSP